MAEDIDEIEGNWYNRFKFRVESLELKVVESPAATIFKHCERSEHINSQLSTLNFQLST